MEREISHIESQNKFEEIKARMGSIDFTQSRNWIHVISHKDSWAVHREGASRADRIFASKADAIARAKSLVENGRATDVIIHRRDGTVEKRESVVEKSKR